MTRLGRTVRRWYPDIRRKNLGSDARAGLVLGVESVPDGLANGLLAGVNPVAGLYGYLFGMVGASFFTSASFMAVQATGAMAIIVADVDLAGRSDPARSLFTLTMVTGVVMVIAGLLRLGSLLRFVSRAVMTGFISAVGVNIVLGQLDTLTGYDSQGRNRVLRAFDLVTHFWHIDLASTAVGLVTIGLIVVLRRTRLGSLGLVVAVIVSSALAALVNALGSEVATVQGIAEVPRSLPLPTLPVLAEIPGFIIPALSLTFVGLVQGAGVSAGIPNPDGSPSNASRDFIGQGAGNILSGLFRGMPVGGSMSASSLVVSAGARSRLALLSAGVVMAIVIVAFGPVVGHVAMPALGGLLIVVGVGTVKVDQLRSVARTGAMQATVVATTFVLTLVVPLQYAVLVGVGIATILHVIRQANRLVMKQIVFTDDGRRREIAPPDTVPRGGVVVLQPYGSVFFATAPILEQRLPEVTDASRHGVVIIRFRGTAEFGATLSGVLSRYASTLRSHGGKLVVVTDNPHIRHQLVATGVMDVLGEQNFYLGSQWVGETVRRAYGDALDFVASSPGADGASDADPA